MHDDREDESLTEQGIAESVRICIASRKFNGSYLRYPRVIKGYVAFHKNDQRFHIYAATTLYIESYLEEHGITLSDALRDKHHVRELIEIITS